MDQLLAMRVYARVVEAGTFTKAAASLAMPNATVTKLVQALEAHLRVKLLQRTTRRVTVTPDGQDYYEKAARLLKDVDDIDASFGAQLQPRGHLRIDMGGSVANLLVIPALPAFFALYPEIHIDVGVSDQQVDLVGDNVDCVIRGGPLTDLGLVGRQIGSVPWVTCAAPAYLARHGTPAGPDELNHGHGVIHYLSSGGNRAVPLTFERAGVRVEVAGQRALGVNESQAHVAAGLAGLGVFQTFAYLARPHLASGALVAILPEWQPAPYPFHVAYPPNRHSSRRLRVWIDWLAAHFPALLDGAPAV